MLFSAELAQPCAAAWYHLERSSDNRTRRRQFSAAEIRALSINGNFEDVIKRIDPDLWEMIFDDARRRRFLVVNDKIGVEAQSILQAQLSRESRNRGSAHTLQHFAAARDEDWIAPMAYAAFRATSGVIPASCIELANSYTRPYGSLIARIGPRPGPRPEENSIPTDILQMLLLADRAGDLPAMATLFADEFVGSARARDLNLLLREHKRWRDQIDRYLAHFPGVDRSAR
jgi:hypothetical protein